jgi:hypothetical protein
VACVSWGVSFRNRLRLLYDCKLTAQFLLRRGSLQLCIRCRLCDCTCCCSRAPRTCQATVSPAPSRHVLHGRPRTLRTLLRQTRRTLPAFAPQVYCDAAASGNTTVHLKSLAVSSTGFERVDTQWIKRLHRGAEFAAEAVEQRVRDIAAAW